ncbi:hypothetical protein G6F68_010278 [Rhizopus microsporus]|nr:hypothetical protein G6F68_010278 [Rhizopus microsporus]
MVAQALERAVPVAGDPVDHEATVAGAQCTGLVTVEEGILLQRRVPALLQVFQRAVAPVLADRIGEGLAVTGGTVEVDHHHRVALARVRLRVPAVAPAVAEAALRAAVDQGRDRVGLAFLVVVRLDHVAVHGVVVPALELELLVVAEGHVLQHLASGRGQRAQLADRLASGRQQADQHLVVALQAVAGDRHAVAGHVDRGHAAVADQLGGLAAGHVDLEQRVFAEVIGGGVDAGAIGGQGNATGRAIPLRGDLAGLAAGKVHRHQAEAVGLEARALHRAVEQGLAVGAEHRAGIPGRVGRGQVDRCLLAGGVEAAQVEVGRPRLLLASHADAGHHAGAIRRPREVIIAAERLGRCIAIDGRAQRRRTLDRTGLGRRQRRHEQANRRPCRWPWRPCCP